MFSTVYLVWITYRYLQSFFLRNTTVPSPPKINTQLPHQMKVGNHGKTWEIMERVLFDDLGHFRSCSKHGLGIGNMWIWHEEYLENPNCKTSTISLMPLFPCSSNIKKSVCFVVPVCMRPIFLCFPRFLMECLPWQPRFLEQGARKAGKTMNYGSLGA